MAKGVGIVLIQVKIVGNGNSLIFDCDLNDYGHLIWLLEMAWERDYDIYIREVRPGDSDEQ